MPNIERYGHEEKNPWRSFLAPLLYSEPVWGIGAPSRESFFPSVDVYETEEDVVVKAEVPGVKPGNMDIMVYPDRATVSAKMDEHVEEKGANYHRRERRSGGFLRTVHLPSEVDTENARASFSDGVLEIRMPKADDPKSRGKRLKLEQRFDH